MPPRVLPQCADVLFACLRRDSIRDNSTSADAASYGGEWTIAGFS